MKSPIVIEDLAIGVICGLLLVGLTGKFFSLELPPMAYAAAFMIYPVFILLDIIHEFSDLTTHAGFIFLSISHNIIDMAISLSFVSYFTKWNIPYITSLLVPYLQDEIMIYYAGTFLVVSNAIWIVIYPFTY